MLKSLVVAAALAAVLGAGFAVAATGQTAAQATYLEGTPTLGQLTISAAPQTQFLVMGQQSDGHYMPIASGIVPCTGSASLIVSHNGPTNDGLPQYMINVTYPDGTTAVVLAGGNGTGNDDRWWLD